MKGGKFLEGFLFRPQGKPMAFPYHNAARLSQFPWRFAWHEAWLFRYFTYAAVFVTWPLYWKIDKYLTSPENKALWKEKRAKDHAEHRHHIEKLWEVRT